MTQKTVAALALSCVLLGAARSRADYGIEGFTPTSTASTSNYTFGYSFTLSQPEYVSGLSVYDANGSAPLADSHEVAIWSASNTSTPLASATVGPTSNVFASPGANSEHFADASLAAPVLLQAGTYFIGAYYAAGSTDAVAATTSAASFGPVIGYQFASYHFGSFAAPTTSASSSQGYIGPNFTYSSQAAVPEPSAMILTGVGAFGLVIGGYLRRKPAP